MKYLLAAILLMGSGTLRAQTLPPYLAVNPVVTSRSGLYHQPYVDAGKRWEYRLLMDYASAIEFTDLPNATFLLDAELLRLDATVTRNLGRGFVGASVGVNGTYGGFLDGFLDWYHELVGLRVAAREVRPRNEFGYEITLPNGDSISRKSHSAFLGDLRLLGGHRHTSFWQTAVAVTLPVAPAGYGRETVSLSAITTFRSNPDRPWMGEASLGVGATGRAGALREFQRTTFVSGSAGMRYRFLGRQAAFVNLFWQSGNYTGTGMKAFDARELTLDYGFLLKARKGPEWFLGMTEDLEPKGPAIDLSFRIGARW